MNSVKIVSEIVPPHPFEAYAHVVRPLTKEEGGGFLITFPDLPGCMSDGETYEETLANGRDAFMTWIAGRVDSKKDIPVPNWRPEEDRTLPTSVSGKFVQRIPKSVHARLVKRAQDEGVSLNTLVLTYVTQGLERSVHNETVEKLSAKIDLLIMRFSAWITSLSPSTARTETSANYMPTSDFPDPKASWRIQ